MVVCMFVFARTAGVEPALFKTRFRYHYGLLTCAPSHLIPITNYSHEPFVPKN